MNHLKNNLDIKLIALDMDGTLLNKKDQIPEANREAIHEAQEKGIYVVLSTGRSFQTSHGHADSLELTSYLVTVNGGEIWDEHRRLIERHPLKSEHIQWMWELTKQYKTGFWAINTERNWRDDMPENINSFEWLKFGFNITDDAVRSHIYKILQTTGEFELSNSTPRNIEVNKKGINKARGLEVVCGRLGIELKNVMAVGDSLNDLAMIKEAGVGIAMGNAQDVVKAAADWTTGTNEEEGVAEAICKWVL